MTNTYVIFTEGGKEQYLAELLMNTVVKNNPESARRIYVPTKATLTKSAQTGQKWNRGEDNPIPELCLCGEQRD